jgi:dienelactone hydrolase
VDVCPPPAPHTTLAAGTTGRIGFQTTTPTTAEFLQGTKPAATHLIWGDLELPQGHVGRSAAVVLVHGSGGVSTREDRWAEVLRQAGAATFLIDSFTGRGIAFTAEDQSQLATQAMIGDAYRALELLATHPRIDPTRIAVMGFSKGGAVALYSAVTRFQRMHGPAGVRFAQHIPFYPPCLRQSPREQNASRCLWQERAEGQMVNRDSGQPFSLDDPCVIRGGTFGPDPAAYRAALTAVKALVVGPAPPGTK